MIVLFMVMSFIIGRDSNFLQDVCFLSFNPSFWPGRCGLLTFPCLWKTSFSCQMIVELSVPYWA